MYARLSEQGANTVLALRQQMQGGLITHEEILARGEEALSGMGTLTDSVLRSAAVQFLKTEYAVAGLNVDHIRNSYLLRTGGKMLLLTLGMIAAAVLCNFAGARMSAAIGRDLRAQVFRKVLSFSSAEMDKFSTASLITRSTNDVMQIQAVCVLIVRVVLYAPIIGLGGIDSGEKALEYLYAGANAVEVGAAALFDPVAPLRVARELDDLLDSRPELAAKLAAGQTWR